MKENIIFWTDKPDFWNGKLTTIYLIYLFRTCCVQILFWMSKQKQKSNLFTKHILKFYFLGKSMNNLLSYCGLTDARMGGFWKRFTCTGKYLSEVLPFAEHGENMLCTRKNSEGRKQFLDTTCSPQVWALNFHVL